jgi:GT2 family glycosyltransferase
MKDERFFMYWEDADWWRRMRQKGWKVVYFPSASVVHYVGASSNTLPVKSTVEFHKSSYRIYKKYTKWPFLRVTAAVLLTVRCILICYSHIFKRLTREERGRKSDNGDFDEHSW